MEIKLPPDFSDFLELLNRHDVKYLLIGGYAVNYYGYVRTTNDMDIWIAVSSENAHKMVIVLKEFGFDLPDLTEELFLSKKTIQMGVVPIRIDVLGAIDGVEFDECYPARVEDKIDGIPVHVINLEHLKQNKRANGRPKDLVDVEYFS